MNESRCASCLWPDDEIEESGLFCLGCMKPVCDVEQAECDEKYELVVGGAGLSESEAEV